MAARLQPAPTRPPELVDLRRLAARDIEALLEEEIESWRSELEWDFEKSADLVRRFVDLRALNGYALIENGEAIGYMYYVLEESKGLIGDVYLRREYRDAERESRLLGAALEAIAGTRGIRRIESQLLMMREAEPRTLARAEWLSDFERNFMRIDLRRASFAEARPRRPMYIEKWSDHYHDAAAQLIAQAYSGHIDSRINDQYRSANGARRFLYNIVQYPGCGTFYRPGSHAAFDAVSGRMIGISLASIVAPECGHITQICVAPSVRGAGVGYALLRQSLTTFQEAGCRSASLTVTASNEDAVALYRRVGFEIVRQFSAYVWEGW